MNVCSRRSEGAMKTIPLNLSFGNFEFNESKRFGQRGGGMRELSAALRKAQQRAAIHSQMLQRKGGLEERNADLLGTAIRRAAGERVKDDPKRLAKALAKRRSKKRSSAKKWAGRLEQIKKSVDNVVEEKGTSRAKKWQQKQSLSNGKKDDKSRKSFKEKSSRGGEKRGHSVRNKRNPQGSSKKAPMVSTKKARRKS
uniref:Ribosomal RNA-processing protein 14/surfeit locus protein 6 C-terminal domain-containing protein n=1 Tax=Trypanosoma congolense (strain IL3000) TaxID=1068625 RepID=G0V0M5_TRYCI|nr:conserved hypothetical protein [Trypanosoma congolense IL3000]